MFLSIRIILSLFVSYLIGSIPTAYIFGKLYKKIDIRQHGSGNVGATNVFRVLGKGPGIIVLIIDIAKGVVATTLVVDLFQLDRVIYIVLLGVTVVAGHNWTCFLQFKGGKGMATSLGVLIGLTIKLASLRLILLSCIGTWIVTFLVSGYVSLASIISAVLFPILTVFLSQPLEIVALSVIFALLLVLKHRPNIRRLLAGEEHRFYIFSKKHAS